MKLPARMAGFVRERKQQSLYRTRRILETAQGPEVIVDGRPMINFSSNDYLGLANHSAVVSAMKKAADQYGAGSGASHLVIGHSTLHHELEEQLADFVGCESALLFSSGYMANMGTLNGLARRGDLILQDKLNHASLLDAGLLAEADMKRYAHNDMDALERRLEGATAEQVFIVTDAVFSMDGDLADLPQLVTLSESHQAVLMIDDAHGFGVLGKEGRGSLSHFQLAPGAVPVYMATLGKALGVCGAFVAGDKDLVDYLIQCARPYIYTTALPPAAAGATLQALKVLQQETWRRHYLQTLIQRFRDGMADWQGRLLPSQTAIQPLVVGSAEGAIQLSDELSQRGFLVSAIRPPTVPRGTARLRITLTAAHTEQQVDDLVNTLQQLLPGALNADRQLQQGAQ
ncbi:MAG: 8-amino-7-oxononanoate synthase [Ketobacteraceae bacterium]|nr:8-amino-7-oxononanoate synthase [Ketobacteraceae bacterium]